MKAIITTRALTQRINRMLIHDKKQLRKDRSTNDWIIIDLELNAVVKGANPEKLGRDLGVIKAWETVE